jgi:uncharacterized membrane protein YraQ (UPF0718 family)
VSLTRLYDTLHQSLSSISGMSENDRHFYLAWMEKEINEARDTWRWIAAAAFISGVMCGFVLAVLTRYG